MHIRLKTPYRPERLLLYATLTTTALLLPLMPNLALPWRLDPLMLFGALLLLSCAGTLFALARHGKNHRLAMGLLFCLWLLVWVSQGLLLPF
ncbi:hypothetical protein [Shewanella sp. Isolate8]|uniref:hypothetical protein n=1 Tax=Shewanella sp. Isolate8 TaxID=2908529 RepID=UPI001EFC5FCE|nr:hypothetical protein [Shewanella sp. Isolate8]MCG9746795.1 hypothetical protein [Shewanella sp. Isolate8]